MGWVGVAPRGPVAGVGGVGGAFAVSRGNSSWIRFQSVVFTLGGAPARGASRAKGEGVKRRSTGSKRWVNGASEQEIWPT